MTSADFPRGGTYQYLLAFKTSGLGNFFVFENIIATLRKKQCPPLISNSLAKEKFTVVDGKMTCPHQRMATTTK
jgi:hypothetical protein